MVDLLEIATDPTQSPLTMMERAALHCRRFHPEWSYSEIAEELGVSRQRAHVLVHGAEDKLKAIKAAVARLQSAASPRRAEFTRTFTRTTQSSF